jgi:hypothetical protein
MKPLAPLMFTPTTSQFFLYTKPSSKIADPFGLHTDNGSVDAVRSSAGRTSNVNGAASGNSSPAIGGSFQPMQDRTVTTTSPKF